MLDLYLPPAVGRTGCAELDNASARGAPVALFCHGGVWASGACPASLQAPWTPYNGARLRRGLTISAHAKHAAACGLFGKHLPNA